MEESPDARLVRLIVKFLSGDERSRVLADQIEGLLLDSFADTELFDELTELVASYNPGGGSHYVGDDEMAAGLRHAMRHLSQDDRPS